MSSYRSTPINYTPITSLLTEANDRNNISKDGKIILSEEEYMSYADYIIKRDYYPDLLAMVGTDRELNCSLDEFLRKYTSEYNASFDEIMEKWKIKNKTIIEKIYEKNAKCNVSRVILPALTHDNNEMKAITNESSSLLMLESKVGSSSDNTQLITYAKSQDHAKFKLDEDYDIEKYKNNLMFYPSGISKLEATNAITSESIIKHSGTRISDTVVKKNDSLTKSQSTIKQYDLDNATEDPQQTLENINRELNSSRGETPSINGVQLETTPIIHPTESTEIMTWGTIESSPFRVPETPKREILSQQLASKASKNIRLRETSTPNQTYSYNRTPSRSFQSPSMSPRTPSSPLTMKQQFNSLSNAAQQLARRHLKTASSKPLSSSSFNSPLNDLEISSKKRKTEHPETE
ncbi:hypothetical protein C9374_001694 [Naegleria lovaniensis]|uniref:Uncharacterized protein n=1 Tax=Naegleria lovaniensis TaxID=51637 RepID=A0AA88GUP6_NAELO|nr:uncharacterized protein C9374_001694 [Naegleria lovaniensis]KAG2387362.1 hypothetical protein C9374_001694 [Naegleria lovaniensis]